MKSQLQMLQIEANLLRSPGGKMTASEAVLELERPDECTRHASSQLERLVDSPKHGPAVLVVDGEQVEIPEPVLQVLLYAVREQAAGHRVRLTAPDAQAELTPNQAANYLGISRPLLVKLLDEGIIPARNLPGSRHRRITIAELEAYQTRKTARRKALATAMNEIYKAEHYFPND